MTDQTTVKPDDKRDSRPCEECESTDHTTLGHVDGGDVPAANGHVDGGAPPRG